VSPCASLRVRLSVFPLRFRGHCRLPNDSISLFAENAVDASLHVCISQQHSGVLYICEISDLPQSRKFTAGGLDYTDRVITALASNDGHEDVAYRTVVAVLTDLAFSLFLPTAVSFEAIARRFSSDLVYESWHQKTRVMG